MAPNLPVDSIWTRKTMRLCRLSSRRPLVTSPCHQVVAQPLVVLSVCRPLVNLLRQLVVASPLFILSLRCPCVVLLRQLVVPLPLAVLSLSHPLVKLVEPACCRIASPRPLVVPRAALSSSRRAGWLLHCLLMCHPLVTLSSCCAASRSLVAPAGCRAIISCHPLVAPHSRPLIVLAGFCVACPCTALSSSHCSPLLMPSKAIKCCCCHQTPPPPPPLNAVSIVHRCYSCRPSSPSNANTHRRPLPLSNADSRHCRLPQLMSIFIIVLSSPICSPHCRCH